MRCSALRIATTFTYMVTHALHVHTCGYLGEAITPTTRTVSVMAFQLNGNGADTFSHLKVHSLQESEHHPVTETLSNDENLK